MRAIQDVFAEALDIGCVSTSMDGTPMTPVANSCEFCNLILGNRLDGSDASPPGGQQWSNPGLSQVRFRTLGHDWLPATLA